MDNRRNIDRTPSRLFVELECSYLRGIAYTADISPKGCQLDSTAELPPGTHLRGQIMIAQRAVPFQGQVRWSRPADAQHSAQLGVSFAARR